MPACVLLTLAFIRAIVKFSSSLLLCLLAHPKMRRRVEMLIPICQIKNIKILPRAKIIPTQEIFFKTVEINFQPFKIKGHQFQFPFQFKKRKNYEIPQEHKPSTRRSQTMLAMAVLFSFVLQIFHCTLPSPRLIISSRTFNNNRYL